MAKTVVVVSKSRDIIQENIDYVLDCLRNKTTYIKKTVDTKSYAKVELAPDKIGFLWFVSSDYTNLITHKAEIKEYIAGNKELKTAFEFDIEDLSDATLARFIEQYKELQDFNANHLYVKLNMEFINNDRSNATLSKLYRFIKENKIQLDRIQADFGNVTISESKQIGVGTTLTALASRFKIPTNSCKSSVFNQKNSWISNEPCISGNILGDIMGCKMVTVRCVNPCHENCMCHKYIDICGTGELFDGDMSKVRNSDKKVELKKIQVKKSGDGLLSKKSPSTPKKNTKKKSKVSSTATKTAKTKSPKPTKKKPVKNKAWSEEKTMEEKLNELEKFL